MKNDRIGSAPSVPSRVYGRSHELQLPGRKHDKEPSKWLVYVLVAIALVAVILFILAQIFFRTQNPKLMLQAVSVKNYRHVNSSNPSVNLTLVCRLSIKNPNQGYFEFDDSTGSFIQGDDPVGGMKIAGGVVGARETKTVDDLRADLKLKNPKNSSEGHPGWKYVDLSSRVELIGRVHVLGMVKKRKVAKINCLLKLDIRSQSFQNPSCD